MKFDCVIPTAGKECLLLRKTIPYIIKYIQPENIYIITKKIFFMYFIGLQKEISSRIILLDEDCIIEGIDFKIIKGFLLKYGHDPKMTGWYYQQFLKMGFANSKFSTEYYLSWDADSIPVVEISFFDKFRRPYFTTKEEFHNPYFLTIKEIIGLSKVIPGSFISENMLFKSAIMRKLILDIATSANCDSHWCENIISNIPKGENNGFSEFETYGTYTLVNYPEEYALRELKTNRNVGNQYTRLISDRNLNKFNQNYDMISIEHRHNPKSVEGYFMFFFKIVQKGLHVLLTK